MDSPNPEAPSMPLGAAFGVRFFRYRTLIKRNWWILALTIGAGLAYQSYVAFSKPQMFESVSRLNIREELIQDSRSGFQDTTGNFFNTSAEQMKFPMVLGKAYDRVRLVAPHLNGTAEIGGGITPRSNIFTVTSTGTNPEFTRLYLDAVVEEFMALRSDSRASTANTVASSLNVQIETIKKELADAKTKLQTFAENNNMEFWQEQSRSSAAFLSEQKNKQANLENELKRIEHLTPDQLLTQAPATTSKAPKAPAADDAQPVAGPSDSVSLGGELYNEYLRKTQELRQRQADYQNWSTVWKPKHPRLVRISEEIKSLKLAVDTIREQNKEATATKVVAIRAELKGLEGVIETWEKKVSEASRKDAQYQTLQADVARAQGSYEKLLTNLGTVEQGRTSSPDPWVVIQKATEAREKPRGTMKHIIIGLLGGFVVGMVILVVMDRTDDRIASSSELLEHFSEPILGQIPNVQDSRKATGLPLLQEEDERYTYAEAFRSLRSSLIFMPNQTELKTILVTSAIPNEGKSTIASNLAVTMAAAGARVLLVDADLRRGDICPLFGITAKTGLTNVLRNEVDWRSTVVNTAYPTLSIIPCGPPTNQSGELLLRPMLLNLLDEFRDHYDLTIFNTAPILATDDTPTLAPNFDGSLMVVRAQFTSARLTKNALNALYQRQVNVLGLILNCVDTETPDYYYYRYPKYYAA